MAKGNIYRIVKNPNNPYVMVNKGFINNSNLSWKAKGILLYLLSKPDDWQVYECDLIKHADDGRDSVRSGIRELEKHGYIVRTTERDSLGKITGVTYDVYELPAVDGFSVDGFSVAGESPPTNNDLVLNNEYTNTSVDEAEKSCPYEKIKDLYNLNCNNLTQIRLVSNTRKEHIKARWKQYNHDLSIFEELFKKTAASKFLNGGNDREWKADFDWLMNENNMAKVLEGKYDNKAGFSSSIYDRKL